MPESSVFLFSGIVGVLFKFATSNHARCVGFGMYVLLFDAKGWPCFVMAHGIKMSQCFACTPCKFPGNWHHLEMLTRRDYSVVVCLSGKSHLYSPSDVARASTISLGDISFGKQS